MAVIVSKSVVFDIPREGAMSILRYIPLSSCDATPATPGINFGLYTNDVVIDDETTLADLDVGTDALAPKAVANGAGVCTNLEGPALDPDEAAITFDQQIWTNATPPGPTTVYGCFVSSDVDGVGQKLLGAIRFDEPVNLPEDDDVLKVTALLRLLPQITPVLP